MIVIQLPSFPVQTVLPAIRRKDQKKTWQEVERIQKSCFKGKKLWVLLCLSMHGSQMMGWCAWEHCQLEHQSERVAHLGGLSYEKAAPSIEQRQDYGTMQEHLTSFACLAFFFTVFIFPYACTLRPVVVTLRPHHHCELAVWLAFDV